MKEFRLGVDLQCGPNGDKYKSTTLTVENFSDAEENCSQVSITIGEGLDAYKGLPIYLTMSESEALKLAAAICSAVSESSWLKWPSTQI